MRACGWGWGAVGEVEGHLLVVPVAMCVVCVDVLASLHRSNN